MILPRPHIAINNYHNIKSFYRRVKTTRVNQSSWVRQAVVSSLRSIPLHTQIENILQPVKNYLG